MNRYETERATQVNRTHLRSDDSQTRSESLSVTELRLQMPVEKANTPILTDHLVIITSSLNM